MSMPLSHFVPAYPSPSPYPQVHSLVGLCLYSHLAPRFFMTIFFFYYFLIDLYWSIIASQYYASFCCTTRQISHIHTHVPISPPSWASLPSSLSHPSRSSQSTELISLCYAAASHQPTILHSLVYICQCYSHLPQLCPPTPCHQVHSLCLPLYFCPANRLISTVFFFLDSIYMR